MISKTINNLKVLNMLIKRINILDDSYKIKESDFLLFCHDANRGLMLNNKAYSPLMDSLKETINKKKYTSTTIAHPWSKIVGEKAYGSPIAINGSFLAAKILKRVFRNSEIQPDVIFYERLFKKANPKVIITIGSPKELCEAARNLRIFHAELLHGIGYTSMKWNWDTLDEKHIPQCILSLDPVSTKTFGVLEKRGVIIKEIKHPFLDRFQRPEIDIPEEWRLQTKDKPSDYEKEILVSLQWGYAPRIDEQEIFKGILENGLFYKELEEVIKKTNHNIYWRFRLHPVQYTQPKKYKEVLEFMDEFISRNKNCEWKESTYTPLPSLLPLCSGHITMSSMCSYEAAYFGIPTLALAPSLQKGGVHEDLFEDLVSSKCLVKETVSVDKVLNWVKHTERTETSIASHIDEDCDTIDWLLLQA